MATDSVYVPEEGAKSALDTWLASADGPVIARLYDNAAVYNPTNTVADYTEASFVGYMPVGPITWPASSINPDGKAQADSPNLDFHFTGGSGTAVIYGMFFTESAGTSLKLVVPFLSPVTLSPGDPDLSKVVKLTDVSEL